MQFLSNLRSLQEASSEGEQLPNADEHQALDTIMGEEVEHILGHYMTSHYFV